MQLAIYPVATWIVHWCESVQIPVNAVLSIDDIL